MTMEMSRRYLLAAGAGALVSSGCGAPAAPPSSPAASGPAPNQEIIRSWYAAWQKTDWGAVEALMADDFTFSSAAGDDHIGKSTYKAQCWESQKGRVERFELEQVLGNGNEALVKYVARTTNGKSFRNVEYFRFRDHKIQAIECYFGDQSKGYPSATDKKG